MGSTQSSHLDSHRAGLAGVGGGVLADYETIYNYFDDAGEASPNQKTKIRSAIKKKSNESAAANNATVTAEQRQHSKSLYEEAVSFGGDQSCSVDERVDCGRHKNSHNGSEAPSAGSKVHFKKTNKLKNQKQINAELMARNAETQLKEMEKRKAAERIMKGRRSRSLNSSHSKQPQPMLQLDTGTAEYWQKRRQLEKVLKSEEACHSVDKKKKHKKREVSLTEDERGSHRGEKSRDHSSTGQRRHKPKSDRMSKIKNQGDESSIKVEDKSMSMPVDDNKREGRSINRNDQDRGPKSRSRSVKSNNSAGKQSESNVKTEAELLEELKQEDDKPTRTVCRELVSQHVPHYALPTKKMELKTDGRLSKLYVPKRPHQHNGEWPPDLDKAYCKMIVDTFKEMYSGLINDPNWVYNQRKSYLNFLNTAEWQEMDLKLAKMSFQQLQEEPLQKLTTY